MKAEQLKHEIIDIFDFNIKFNKDFDTYIYKLKVGMQKDFIEWCRQCKEGNILGSVPPKNKDLFVFFKKIGNNIRVVLIKQQNKDFIEIILSNHLNYDKKRQELGYKKSSYYAS